TTLAVSRYWDLSSGWQRAINLRWSFDHFTQGNVTNTTMLFYPLLPIVTRHEITERLTITFGPITKTAMIVMKMMCTTLRIIIRT
ncbi:hypothetical protein MJI46_32935, partial [Salmonella enterica subsp. enterica serovar Cerro]|nr:hypothetical protein [Salmonella enterica subsp. enterica serovar Cerro]